MKTPCRHCPFRADSPLGYDADALEALKTGQEPSCHVVVGMESIFNRVPDQITRCVGHDAWAAGVPGFVEPHLAQAS